MAESVELSLTFELGPPWTLSLALLSRFLESEDSDASLHQGQEASLADCEQLLSDISGWLQPALELELYGYREVMQRFDVFDEAFNVGAPPQYRSLPARVKTLHYGSPFEIQLLLPLLSPAGLAGIFYAAKRLYGIDLEFKAHREKRRAEYREAKRRADQLAGPSSKSGSVSPASRWRLVRGGLRDPDSS